MNPDPLDLHSPDPAEAHLRAIAYAEAMNHCHDAHPDDRKRCILERGGDCLCRVAAEAWIAEQEAKAWKPTRAGVAGKAAEAPDR